MLAQRIKRWKYTTCEKVQYHLKADCDKLNVHIVNPRETNKKTKEGGIIQQCK